MYEKVLYTGARLYLRRDRMFLYVNDKMILTELFSAWVSDQNAIDWEDPDRKTQVRCAITAYSHYVQNLLNEHYEVDAQPEEVSID